MRFDAGMNTSAMVVTTLLVVLAASIAVLVGGIVLAAKGTGRAKKVGWWVAIVASLFVLAFGTVIVMGAITSASLGQNPFA